MSCNPFGLMKAFLLSLCCLAVFFAQPSSALVISVATNGSTIATLHDLKKDTKASVSLARAIVLLKSSELRDEAGTPKESITLQLASGTYRLSETLKLETAHSGSAEHPVNIQGALGSEVIISGGRDVNGFVPVDDANVLKRLPKVARPHVLQTNLVTQGITDFGIQSRHGFGSDAGNPTALEITYQNQPMQLARWPNQGFATIASTPNGEKGITFTLQGANITAWKYEPD